MYKHMNMQFKTRCIITNTNSSGAESEMFRENIVSNMIADDLAPRVARP